MNGSVKNKLNQLTIKLKKSKIKLKVGIIPIFRKGLHE